MINNTKIEINNKIGLVGLLEKELTGYHAKDNLDVRFMDTGSLILDLGESGHNKHIIQNNIISFYCIKGFNTSVYLPKESTKPWGLIVNKADVTYGISLISYEDMFSIRVEELKTMERKH